MATIRFGLIGAGAIAHHATRAILEHEQGTVQAAHDLNTDRLQELCAEYDIPNSHTTAEALFADPEVDAVYIATPNKFHAPLAIQALEAGKHVILEKPFAMNSTEAREVVTTAERVGKVFTLGMNQRFVEDHQKIKFHVDNGLLGEVYHAKAFWFRRTGIPRLGTWFGNKELAGGGALLDIGVHLLDVCLYTIGNFEPVSVTGATYSKFGPRGLGEGGWGKSDREDIQFDVDDFASAMIKLKNGATVTLDVSWACHQEDANRMGVQLYGTEAGASLAPAKVFRYGDISQYDVVDDVEAELAYPHKERFHNFINALNGEEELCCTTQQALAVQAILDAIYESCKTGREVRLDEQLAAV